jgi:Raf kinase inhibitor-like YbhB/YbcL family protein
MSIQMSSPAFAANQPIPTRYAQEGQNVSPPLSWAQLPPGTQELALIVEDPDAPKPEPFVHWVIYKIPGDVSQLIEGISPEEEKLQLPPGALQGQNSKSDIGYMGPAPPKGHGTHHYHFRLYALDQPLMVDAGLDNKQLLAAMAGHVLQQADIVGTYER